MLKRRRVHNVPTPELWHEKALLAGQAARQAFDTGNLPAAANRAYFSLHAFLNGALADSGQQAPSGRGNFAHSQLPDLIRHQFKTSFHKSLMLRLLWELGKLRVYADYDDHRQIPPNSLEEALRCLAQVISSRER
jgi:hypothetical protein